MSDASETNSQAPKWISTPFANLLNEMADQEQLLHLAFRGIAGLQSSPLVAEAASRIRNEKLTYAQRERLMAEAETARNEVANDFPMFHAQAVIALWHSLETHLRHVLVAWLANDPRAFEAEAVRNIKVKLGEYLAIDEEERIAFIADQLDQQLSAPLKLGIGRFESLFEPFGLSGPVDDLVRKTIFELQQVRNVLVHRGGRADRHLLQKCPWLPHKLGECVTINHMTFQRFSCAVFIYVMELCIRFGSRFKDVGDWCRQYANEEQDRLRHLDSLNSYRLTGHTKGMLLDIADDLLKLPGNPFRVSRPSSQE